MITPRRLKILMIIPQLGYGGAETAFLRLATYLASYAEVTIALMARDYGDGGYSLVGRQTDLPIVMLDNDRPPSGAILAKAARWWRMLRRLRKLKQSHDVAISFLSGANFLNAISGPKNKTIVSERGSKQYNSALSNGSRFLWNKIIDPLTYAGSARIIAASDGLAGEIVLANPKVCNRTFAIEGTVNARQLITDADATLDDDLAHLGEFELIVSYGRLHEQKGFDFLLRVIADVRRTRHNVKLLLIGDGPQTDALYLLAESLGLRAGTAADVDADVIFAGYRKNPIRFGRLGRAFVLPSHYEGLPNALIEALATGVPVLASDCPWGPRSILSGPEENLSQGPLDLPKHLTYGILMPLPDKDGSSTIWAQEIIDVLNLFAVRKENSACMDAISRFDIEKTGQSWLKIIQDVVPVRSDLGD